MIVSKNGCLTKKQLSKLCLEHDLSLEKYLWKLKCSKSFLEFSLLSELLRTSGPRHSGLILCVWECKKQERPEEEKQKVMPQMEEVLFRCCGDGATSKPVIVLRIVITHMPSRERERVSWYGLGGGGEDKCSLLPALKCYQSLAVIC